MSELISEIASLLTGGFKNFTIVSNPDGFLTNKNVLRELSAVCNCEILVGNAISLRVYFELNIRRHPEVKSIYILTDGEPLPDILINANSIRFRVADLFPNFADKETISKLSLDVLSKIFSKHIQGNVSAEKLNTIIEKFLSQAAENTTEDYGEAADLFNEIESPDWSDVGTIKRISQLFVKAVSANKYAEINGKIDELNFDFQHYLDDTFWNSINANPIINPRCVNGIIKHISNNYDNSKKIALVVVDGMAFWQYEILRQCLEEIHISPKAENWTYSWIPSITALARQAIFRGDNPLMDYVQSPQSERQLWQNNWSFATSPQYYYDSEELHISPNCKRLAFVTVSLDEKMHSSSSYLDLLALTKNWASEFANTIKKIKDKGFTIILTTDHGNVLAKGWRSFTQQERAHLYGKISRGRRHAVFMNEAAVNDFSNSLGYHVRFMHRDNWFSIRDFNSFTTQGKIEITHGGTHFFEMIIPFIKF